MSRGGLHHVELRTADLPTAEHAWGWLLGELGHEPFQHWDGGRSWRLGDLYVVLEAAPLDGSHDRRRPGLSHLAFHAGSADDVDRLWSEAPAHRAAFLEDCERFKVELVAA